MKKYGWLFALILFVGFLLASSAKADTPPPPWSEVIPSRSGKYVLVLISPKIKEQQEYVRRSREFWRTGGISQKEIPQAEKALQREIDKETVIRKRYSESGLYTTDKIARLLWKIDLFDGKSWIKVSDDGRHVIAGKWAIPGITEERPLDYNPEIKKVVSVHPKMEETILTFYSAGNQLRSYRGSELTSPDEGLEQTTTNDFLWTNDELLDENANTLVLTKKNGDKLTFDMDGNLISGKLLSVSSSDSGAGNEPQSTPGSQSYCGGIALVLGLAALMVVR